MICEHCGMTQTKPVAYGDSVSLEGPVLTGPNGEVKMCKSKASIVEVLLRHFGKFVDQDTLYNACHGHRPDCDQPEIKIIAVNIHHIKREIAGTGLAIENQHGYGWRLTFTGEDHAT